MFIDVLPIGDKDGLCDECGNAVCGDGKCVDENGDGGCDICGHSNYVEQPEPEPEPEPDLTPEPGGPDSSDDSEGGCGGVIAIGAGSIVLAGAAIAVAAVVVRKKRK